MAEYELREGILVIAPGTVTIELQEFAEREDIRKVILPQGLRSIEAAAFLSCPALRHVSFPDSLEEIGEYAFHGCGLKSVEIPASVKEIGDCAFFSCEDLQQADVLGNDTVIRQDAFGSNYRLITGYIAPGYPQDADFAAELLYSLLWLSCPDRHDAKTSARAESYIRNNQQIIMERILKGNNTAAMTGLAARGLLTAETVEAGLPEALRNNLTEISALLLKMKQDSSDDEEEFAL